jgi:hypothetical protein
MSDRAVADDTTMKVGLLMESAQVHQKLAEGQLEKLRAHTADLDVVVRDEIRRTLVDELQLLTAETTRAARALQKLRSGAATRGMVLSLAGAMLCSGIPIALARWALPSPADIAPDARNWLRALRGSNSRAAASTGGDAAKPGASVFVWTARLRVTAKRRTTT